MAGSLSVRRKNAAKARQRNAISRGQSISTRRPGVVERIYDVIDEPLMALGRRLGLDEQQAYEFGRKVSGGVEGLTGASATEMSGRRIGAGKGGLEDYLNVGLAVVPGAVGAAAKKVKGLRNAARYTRKEDGDFLRVEREGVKPQIVPEAKEAKTLDELRTILRNPETNPAARAANEYTQAAFNRPYDVNMPAPGTSLEKQSGIARVFQAGVEGSPEYKSALFEAYGANMPEVVEAAKAQNYDQLVEAAYRQLGKETQQQFASMPVRTAYHYGAGEYPTPSAMLRDVLGEGNLNVYRGGDPHEFLGEIDPDTGLSLNEMFRAVHDYYGHGTRGSTFRPGGEELAYASHGQMMSPLAQMALLSETRGQNSLVNYSPLNAKIIGEMNKIKADIDEAKLLSRMRGEKFDPSAFAAENARLRELGSQFEYAPQQTLLLPPEYLPADTAGGVPEYLRPVIKPRAPTGPERAVHLSRVEDLTATDPAFYGTGHRGEDWALRGKRGSPAEQTSFYLGPEGTVVPEQVVANVNPFAYETRLSGLYDLDTDPEGIAALARAYAPIYKDKTAIPDFARMAREYGYKGYRTSNFSATPGQGAANVFDPVELIRRISRGERGYSEGGEVSSNPSMFREAAR